MVPRTLTTLLTIVLASVALAGCAQNDGGTTPTPTSPGGGSSNDVYGLTSGNTGGTYYAIANGIQAAVRNATSAGFSITEVPTSGGSVTNVERLRANDYQIALMQNDVAYLAYNGEGQFAGNAYTGLRAVAALYPETLQIVTLESTGIQSVQDLAGKRVSVGAPGSGVEVGANDVINASGISVTRENLEITQAAERLKEGGIDAFFWIGGTPTSGVTALAATHDVRIVPIGADLQQQIRADKPFYASVTLAPGTYTGVDEPVETLAVIAVIVAREDMPADDVASLLRIIFDGQDVQRSHPGQGPNIKLENAQQGIEIPWHEGARQYFQEKGITLE